MIKNHNDNFFDFENFYYHVTAVLGVHCDIYRSAYGTS
jgi:hypothetical protein